MTHTLDSYGGTNQLKGKSTGWFHLQELGGAQMVYHTRGQRLFPGIAGPYLYRQQSANRAKASRR